MHKPGSPDRRQQTKSTSLSRVITEGCSKAPFIPLGPDQDPRKSEAFQDLNHVQQTRILYKQRVVEIIEMCWTQFLEHDIALRKRLDTIPMQHMTSLACVFDELFTEFLRCFLSSVAPLFKDRKSDDKKQQMYQDSADDMRVLYGTARDPFVLLKAGMITAVEVYTALSELTINLAQKEGISLDSPESLEKLLREVGIDSIATVLSAGNTHQLSTFLHDGGTKMRALPEKRTRSPLSERLFVLSANSLGNYELKLRDCFLDALAVAGYEKGDAHTRCPAFYSRIEGKHFLKEFWNYLVPRISQVVWRYLQKKR